MTGLLRGEPHSCIVTALGSITQHSFDATLRRRPVSEGQSQQFERQEIRAARGYFGHGSDKSMCWPILFRSIGSGGIVLDPAPWTALPIYLLKSDLSVKCR